MPPQDRFTSCEHTGLYCERERYECYACLQRYETAVTVNFIFVSTFVCFCIFIVDVNATSATEVYGRLRRYEISSVEVLISIFERSVRIIYLRREELK